MTAKAATTDTADIRTPPIHPMPFVRIELAVLSVMEGALQVLLGRRAEAPMAGHWALPGGVLRIDLDADLDGACQRTARERLGIELPGAMQLAAVGGRSRDPRAPWALSVVYRCMVTPGRLAVEPGKRMAELKWVPADAAIADDKLAFDHGRLIDKAVQSLRAEVEVLRFAPGLMEQAFTLGELQAASEAVLGRPLDKSSFRRRLDAAGCVKPVPGELRTGPFRPAQLFQWRPY